MNRLSFTSSQIENVVVSEGLVLDNRPTIIPTSRGSVALLSIDQIELVLKYADLDNSATEGDISPSRSEGIRNEATILSILPEDIAPTLYAYKDQPRYVYSLSRYIKGERLSEVEVDGTDDMGFMIRALIQTVTRINQNNILHGDIHPGNVLLRDRRRPVLLDFELAHSIYNPPVAPGFVHYLSPEAAKKEMIGECFTHDQREETFALTATILSILTGSFPPNYMLPEIPSRPDALKLIANGVGYHLGAVDKTHINLAKSLKQMLESPADQRPNSPEDLYAEIEGLL